MEFNMAVYSTNVSRLHRNAPRSPRILQQKYNEKGTPKDGRKIHLSFRVRQKAAVPLKRSYFLTSENPSSEVHYRDKATVRDVIYELSFPSIIEWV